MYFMAMGAGAAWFVAPPTFKNRIHSLSHLQNDYNMTDDDGAQGCLASWTPVHS